MRFRFALLAPHLALVCTLLAMAGLMSWGSRDDSPTEDELTHLVRGIAYWQAPDTRLSYGHPALGNAWTALPVAFDADNPRIEKLNGWKTATAAKVTKAYVEKDYGRAREQLMRARMAPMALGLLLVTYLFYWSRAIFGLRTALAVTLFTAFNPVVIAQCRYVTTDPAAMIGFVIGVGEFVRYLRGGRFSIWLMPLGLALGLLTKYSGMVLIPFALVTGVAVCAAARGRFQGLAARPRWLELAKHMAIAAGVITLAINVTYKFNDTGLTVGQILDKPEPQYWVSSRYDDLMERFTPLPKLPRSLRVPIPYTYLFGIAGIRGHTTSGFTSYFWGQRITKAPVTYFPVLLAIKNPPGELAFLLAGAALVAWRRRIRLETGAVLSAAVVFLLVASRSNLAMGVRHVLPVVALLGVLAGRSFDKLWELWSRREVRGGLGAVLSTTLLSAVTAGPDFLGYFNVLAGGRAGGHRISIYGEDWGQDRVKLVKLVKERRLTPLYYDPQTGTRALEVRYLKLRYSRPRCGMTPERGWLALHALTYHTRDIAKCYPFIAGKRPDIEINDHIYLFKIDAPKAAPAPQVKPNLGEPEALPDDPQP